MRFKYDLHVHTKEISPCARLSIEEIIDKYIEEGYSGLVLTDHFRKGYFRKCKREEWKEKTKEFFYSYDRGIEYCKDKDFYIGLGMEISFDHEKNDYLVFGFEKEENPRLIAIGGSDVHKEEDLCRTGIGTNKKITCDEELLRILRNKEFEII